MLDETWQEAMKNSVDGMLDGDLVDFYQRVREEALMAEAKMQYAEFCLIARMLESGASEMMGDIKDGKASKAVRTSRAVEWDYSILNQLKEYFPPEQLTGIYIPEHEKAVTVKEKWNMSKGRQLAKFGKDQAQIINDARISNRSKIEIKEVNFDE